MTNEERARIGARLEVVRKRLGDLTAPAADSRDGYVWGLVHEALDAAEAECVPVQRPGLRKPRKAAAPAPLTTSEQAEEAARRG